MVGLLIFLNCLLFLFSQHWPWRQWKPGGVLYSVVFPHVESTMNPLEKSDCEQAGNSSSPRAPQLTLGTVGHRGGRQPHPTLPPPGCVPGSTCSLQAAE